jgi:hypothetical protein
VDFSRSVVFWYARLRLKLADLVKASSIGMSCSLNALSYPAIRSAPVLTSSLPAIIPIRRWPQSIKWVTASYAPPSLSHPTTSTSNPGISRSSNTIGVPDSTIEAMRSAFSRLGETISPSTLRLNSMLRYSASRRGFSSVSHRIMLYLCVIASSSIARTLAVKNGFVTSDTTTPMILLSRVRRLRATTFG